MKSYRLDHLSIFREARQLFLSEQNLRVELKLQITMIHTSQSVLYSFRIELISLGLVYSELLLSQSSLVPNSPVFVNLMLEFFLRINRTT